MDIISHIKSILQSHNMEHFYTSQTQENQHPFIHNVLHKKQCGSFNSNVFQNKLRSYGLFKTQPGCEKYLREIENEAVRQSLTKFRISNHILTIEKGRHMSPIAPREAIGPGKVEDEIHFLLSYPV